MTQKKALEILKSGKNVFLTGEPGSGKTHTINQYREWMRDKYLTYAMTASTGIAATHVSGITIHSWSGLGIKRDLTKSFVQNLPFDERLARRINTVNTLIIDEISMLDAKTLQNIDTICKAVRQNQEPFGGLQIIFVGDFFQLPPVVKEGEMKFAFESDAWKEADLTVCYLTEQHRQSEGMFLDILSSMRAGTVTNEHKNILMGRTKVDEPQMHLYTHNREVDGLNHGKLDALEGEESQFEMKSSGIPFLVDVLKRSVLSPELLRLKVGATVMFTRNNFEVGFVNGTIGEVIAFEKGTGFPVVRTTGGDEIIPQREEWAIEESGQQKASVRQFPLRLAWAITVHKSQGMSLDTASIDLSKTFEYGQGYVAISRVRSLEGLHLKGLNKEVFAMHPKVVEMDKEFRKLSEKNI